MASMLSEENFSPLSPSQLRGTTTHTMSNNDSTSASSIETYEKRLQVIIDIDDTVKSSGGLTIGGIPIGGIDTQFSRGSLYPGVFRFILGLSRFKFDEIESEREQSVDQTIKDSTSTSQSANSLADGSEVLAVSHQIEPLKVAVLTARAEEFKFALQIKQSDPIARRFAETGKQYGYEHWGIGHVMYGSVKEWIIHEHKGWRKFENFKLLRELYPEGMEPSSYIFLGDTGELDKDCGMRMLIDPETRLVMKAVFLHVVSFDDNPDIPADSFINGKPIVYFRTYVGAALKAVEYDLMTIKEAKLVIIQTCRDMSSTMMAHIGGGGGIDEKLGSKWDEIKGDIVLGMEKYPDELGDLDLNDLQAPVRAK